MAILNLIILNVNYKEDGNIHMFSPTCGPGIRGRAKLIRLMRGAI